MEKEFTPLQILKNWAKLAVILGIIPWSYYYTTSLAPIVNHTLGLDRLRNLKAGVYLFPIVLPPLVLFSLLSRGDDDEVA